MIKTQWTFSTGCVSDIDQIYVAASADALEPLAGHTSLYRWVPELSDGTPDSAWLFKNVDWRAASVTALIPESGNDWWLCALSEEGDVLYTGPNLSAEKIPGAGVYSDDAQGWGYLSDLQQVGEHLYAAGYMGQVYKRLGPHQWVHMDQGILQSKDLAEGQYSIQVINGPHENAIYVAGCIHLPHYPARASYWNGSVWRDLSLPKVADRITNIYVESEERIWMCGANGTLLLGNAKDGFRSLSTVNDNQLFLSVCMHHDRIVLGSNLGLFIYDPAKHDQGIRKFHSNLQPELQDANIVDAVGDVLWSIGPKDIARFDGVRWERIHHPDNVRIGV